MSQDDADARPTGPKAAERRDIMAARIRERMRVLGLNQLSAAKKAGLGQDFVRDILRGKVLNPSGERLGKLAEALECSIYYLIGTDDVPIIQRDAEGEDHPIPPPSQATDESTHKQALLLPIRFELLADSYRRAQDVTRAPLGFEAATVPGAYAGRRCWWELQRDDSMDELIPPGALVMVAEFSDEERHLIQDGDVVVIVKRLSMENSKVHLVERSLRRVHYRYPELGLWFLEFSSVSPQWPAFTDDVFRETEPTAPRRPLSSYVDDLDPAEQEKWRDLSASVEAKAREVQERRARGEPDPPLTERQRQMFEAMDSPEQRARLEFYQSQRPRLAGKVIRILTPLDPAARFGVRVEP
jgi:transcriptional regulator with XRE-family HTH domain